MGQKTLVPEGERVTWDTCTPIATELMYHIVVKCTNQVHFHVSMETTSTFRSRVAPVLKLHYILHKDFMDSLATVV